jgi:PTS system nitrogen regulatory IIA component
MKLTITQVACALDLPAGKIERWIRQGRIPLARQDDICTFDRQTLQRWASQHNLAFRPEGRREAECPGPDTVDLAAALQNGGIYYDVRGTTPAEAFTAVVDQMPLIPPEDKAGLVAKLEEREALASTGIGKGIAIPHPRDPESLGLQTPAVAVGFLAAPIDFMAVDGQPVTLVFLLIAPGVRTHLQLLSRLSFCLRQDTFVAFLKQRPAPEALMTRLEQLAPPGSERDQRPR